MTEHTEIRRKLSDFLDDAITDAERALIASHLAECAQCRKALIELEKTISHLKSLPEVEPPPWLTAKIMAQVRDEAVRPSLWRRLFLPLHVKLPVEAFAILFICVMGYYLAHNNEQLVSPSAPLPADEEQRRPAEAPAAPTPAAPAASPAPPAPAARPATAPTPAAPPAPAPAARDAKPNATALSGHPKSSSPAARQAAPEPKPAPQAAAQEPQASAPPRPARAPHSEAPTYAAPPPHAPGPQARTFDAPDSQSPLSLLGTPAPDGSSSEERQHHMAKAKKAAEQVRVKEQYEQASSEAARRTAAAGQSRQATSRDAADLEGAPTASRLEEGGEPGTVPTVTRSEILLKVNDPVAAVDAVERAVSRSGGTIVKRAYDQNRHRLVVRMEPDKLSSLQRQLAKVGTIQKSPQPPGDGEAAVEVTISW